MVCLLKNGSNRIAAASALMAALLLQSAGPAAAQDNITAGQRVFTASCAMCHMATANGHSMIGPNLYAVVGRQAGAVPGYAYSPTMRRSAIIWTPAQIEAFVQRPARVVPGTRMAFAGVRTPEQASTVVAYLNSLHAPAAR